MVEAGFVHRDISYNNVMLFSPETRDPAEHGGDYTGHHGTLIDLDYTTRINRRTTGGIQGTFGGRTVSLLLISSIFHRSL